jgi:hypothetical protein
MQKDPLTQRAMLTLYSMTAVRVTSSHDND